MGVLRCYDAGCYGLRRRRPGYCETMIITVDTDLRRGLDCCPSLDREENRGHIAVGLALYLGICPCFLGIKKRVSDLQQHDNRTAAMIAPRAVTGLSLESLMLSASHRFASDS